MKTFSTDTVSPYIVGSDYTESNDIFGTQPFVKDSVFPSATLSLVNGSENSPNSLPLFRDSELTDDNHQWTIGRVSEKGADVIINCRQVSGLHATIWETPEGFQIRDELSSGGTYITPHNSRTPIKLAAHSSEILEDQDIINFNSIAYRFEVHTNRPNVLSEATEPASRGNEYDDHDAEEFSTTGSHTSINSSASSIQAAGNSTDLYEDHNIIEGQGLSRRNPGQNYKRLSDNVMISVEEQLHGPLQKPLGIITFELGNNSNPQFQ